MDTKSLRVEVKDETKGEVTALFSTYDVVDSDGDVTLKGAFTDGAEVVISAYGHTSWNGVLPVGKGVVRAGSKDAVLEGQFFLSTAAGRDTFEAVKQLGELGQWSYGYDVTKHSYGQHKGQEVRFLEGLLVHEVSPVLVGAGVGTRTLSAKSRRSLQDQITEAMGLVSQVIDSAERVVALRAEAGKQLSRVNADGLVGLREQLKRLDGLLDVPEAELPTELKKALEHEFLRFEMTRRVR
jgi:HK97 family phage prohead protease